MSHLFRITGLCWILFSDQVIGSDPILSLGQTQQFYIMFYILELLGLVKLLYKYPGSQGSYRDV